MWYADDVMICIFKKRYYFDSGSFTPINPKASEVMQCILRVQTKSGMGNPLSVHQSGQNAKDYLEQARTGVAKQYQIKADNVVFTSGATEANLLALRTAVLHARRRGIALADMHIVTGNEEHASVYKNISYFQTLGVKHTTAVPQDGRRFTPTDITKHITRNTVALTLQLVNSRHGMVQPIADIARACKEKHPALFIHTDATQGTAYYNCSPVSFGVDAVTIDSAKSFGPQGVGALLFQKAHIYGGLGNEHSSMDLRPGTPSVALIYGFAVALNETYSQRKEKYEKSKESRDYIVEELKKKKNLSDGFVHGIEKKVKEIKAADWKKVAPHMLYLSFSNTRHAYLAALLDTQGFFVSTGSACSTLKEETAEEAVRISVLPTTTKQSVQKLVRCIEKQLPIARKL